MPEKILRVSILGGFSLTYGDQSIVGINTVRLQSLLAYLILHAGTQQPRQHVAFLLWPDTSESNARNNLRQFLHQPRHALPDPDRFLVITPQTLCWQTDADQIIDVQRFEHALTEAAAAEQHADSNNGQQRLQEALSIYQGDLLPSCYDDWITPERDRLRQQCLAAHQKLMHLLEQHRDYAAALQVAQASLRLDPLDESTYLTLMRLHDLNHDRPSARRVYLTAVETLQRELGVEPGEALRQAYERIQHTSETHYPDHAASSLNLVGRQIEWQQLQTAWQHATDGDAQLVLIAGEAGIGKSRLAEELFRWAEQQSFTVAQTRSYAAEGRLSFAPVAEWLRSTALRPHVNTLDHVWLAEVTRLLPELLSERTDLIRPEPITEYGQRQRFFEALARAILAAPQPMLLWIDDLQWCDPETLEWLHFLLRFKPHHPLLVLGTVRSEESPRDYPLMNLTRQLRAESKLTTIELAPLDAAESARLAALIQGHELTIAASVRLYRETEGNPLFVVETMRANLGGPFGDKVDGTAQTEQQARVLPPRVYAVIAGRLAQLSPMAHKIAEIGAAIGRAFTFDVLQQAGQEQEDNIVQALDELGQKRIVREQSANVFDFTHDKLREVAYAEISAPQLRLLHRRIAQALESLHANQLDPVSAQIAAHYEQAGLLEQALPYYQRAGELAANLYANNDAIDLLTRGIALLTQLPAGAQCDKQELGLQLALSPLYSITKGWAAPEVEQVLNRALTLGNKVGSAVQRAQILYSLQTVYAVQSQLEKVEEIYPEMHRLFVQTRGSSPPFARLMYTAARFHAGHFLEAREQYDDILAVHDDWYLNNLQASQGVNYLVMGHVYRAHALWCLGYAQSALANASAATTLANERQQPLNQALAIAYTALLQEWCVDADTFRSIAENAHVLTREYQAPYYYAWASILVRFTQAWHQPDMAQVAQLREAIRAFANTGAHLRLPVYFSLLARACQHAGHVAEGLHAIEQGLAEAQQTGEHWWDAELHRLRGELIGAQGAQADEVETALKRSIEIARSQQAKSLELRAATSLARLWQATGRSEAARQLLVPLYGWFIEGFDTPDLQAAQSLIAQL
jgi:predicted ATPase/DNA-binding SARP family transcriptional activator